MDGWIMEREREGEEKGEGEERGGQRKRNPF
jgi:hypothetical protein